MRSRDDPPARLLMSLDAEPMHWRQISLVALCIALNGMDGFDVLSISFAAPGIAREWAISQAVLGVVLSIELFGMALGSVTWGNIADRIGRRPSILWCLALMAAGMLATAAAPTLYFLVATRLVTGFGIGGMLSATSAIVAESSNSQRRDLALSLNIAGYSAGAILGGSVVSGLLADHGHWRSVFLLGGVANLILLPVAWVLMLESIEYLSGSGRPATLEKVNSVLRSFGREDLTALPAPRPRGATLPLGTLFSGRLASATVLLTVAYLTQIMVFYFVQKWTPKIMVDLGHSAAEAATVLVIANIGCFLGAVFIGVISQWVRLLPVVVGAMVAAFVCVAAIGARPWGLAGMAAVCACSLFFVNAAVVGLYPIMARTFPSEVRASGIGFAIGVGRGGAALGPIVAGALLAAGQPLGRVTLLMGSAALVAALMIVILWRRPVLAVAPGE